MVRELNGRNLAQYYLLDKDQLLEKDHGDSEESHAGGTSKDKKDKKDKKKGKGGGEEVPGDAVEFLLEVVIDETRMVVPNA